MNLTELATTLIMKLSTTTTAAATTTTTNFPVFPPPPPPPSLLYDFNHTTSTPFPSSSSSLQPPPPSSSYSSLLPQPQPSQLSPPQTRFNFTREEIANYHYYPALLINRYVTPIWYLIGITGNIVSALVWLRPTMRRNSSSAIYLASLSVNDAVVLLLHPFYELTYTWFVSAVDYPVLCEVYAVLFLSSQYMAPFLVLCFTVDRYIAICYPFKKHSFCTVKRALQVVGGMVVLSLSLCVIQAYFWTYDYDKQKCTVRENILDTLWTRWTSSSETIVFLLVPLVNLLVNIRVIREIYRLSSSSPHLQQSSQLSVSLSRARSQQQLPQQQHQLPQQQHQLPQQQQQRSHHQLQPQRSYQPQQQRHHQLQKQRSQRLQQKQQTSSLVMLKNVDNNDDDNNNSNNNSSSNMLSVDNNSNNNNNPINDDDNKRDDINIESEIKRPLRWSISSVRRSIDNNTNNNATPLVHVEGPDNENNNKNNNLATTTSNNNNNNSNTSIVSSKSLRGSKRLSVFNNNNNDNNYRNNNNKIPNCPGSAAATNAMLLSVSFYVIFTTLPPAILYSLENYFEEGPSLNTTHPEISENEQWRRYIVYYYVQTIVYEIALSHYACNLILFTLTGRKFRLALVRTLRCVSSSKENRDTSLRDYIQNRDYSSCHLPSIRKPSEFNVPAVNSNLI